MREKDGPMSSAEPVGTTRSRVLPVNVCAIPAPQKVPSESSGVATPRRQSESPYQV